MIDERFKMLLSASLFGGFLSPCALEMDWILIEEQERSWGAGANIPRTLCPYLDRDHRQGLYRRIYFFWIEEGNESERWRFYKLNEGVGRERETGPSSTMIACLLCISAATGRLGLCPLLSFLHLEDVEGRMEEVEIG